jgi:hypothetical protein
MIATDTAYAPNPGHGTIVSYSPWTTGGGDGGASV